MLRSVSHKTHASLVGAVMKKHEFGVRSTLTWPCTSRNRAWAFVRYFVQHGIRVWFVSSENESLVSAYSRIGQVRGVCFVVKTFLLNRTPAHTLSILTVSWHCKCASHCRAHCSLASYGTDTVCSDNHQPALQEHKRYTIPTSSYWWRLRTQVYSKTLEEYKQTTLKNYKTKTSVNTK